MDHKSIEKLIQDREAETQRQRQDRELASIAKSDAALAAFKRFYAELEKTVGIFNEKNPDKGLGQFTCERRTDSVIAVVRLVGDSHNGQVAVSLNKNKASLDILHQPGGPEQQDQIELRPNLDGQVYFWGQNRQVSTAHAVEQVFRRFILAIER